MLGGSILYDVIWLSNNSQNWFIRTVTVLILLLKVRSPPHSHFGYVSKTRCAQFPTVLAFATALRQRGASFSGLGIRGNDLSGATGTCSMLLRTSRTRVLIPLLPR